MRGDVAESLDYGSGILRIERHWGTADFRRYRLSKLDFWAKRRTGCRQPTDPGILVDPAVLPNGTPA
jgi:hypothetical protein